MCTFSTFNAKKKKTQLSRLPQLSQWTDKFVITLEPDVILLWQVSFPLLARETRRDWPCSIPLKSTRPPTAPVIDPERPDLSETPWKYKKRSVCTFVTWLPFPNLSRPRSWSGWHLCLTRRNLPKYIRDRPLTLRLRCPLSTPTFEYKQRTPATLFTGVLPPTYVVYK